MRIMIVTTSARSNITTGIRVYIARKPLLPTGSENVINHMCVVIFHACRLTLAGYINVSGMVTFATIEFYLFKGTL